MNSATGFRFEGRNAVAPDGTVFARRFRRGVFNSGRTSIAGFIEANPEAFPNLPPSLLRVMAAVSANEGRLEAINTWDNAFLTFGIFQWTAGTGAAPGELPGLIDRLKRQHPRTFQRHFGDFGLDVAEVRGALPRGRFALDGTVLRTAIQKARLRTLEWAYRFWLAGHDDVVRWVQIEHAAGRIDDFYRNSHKKIGQRYVADYVTSEYGVALLLDQHVNRPGHVPKTLAQAVRGITAELCGPEAWGSTEERQLLARYLDLRHETSMTSSAMRAKETQRAVARGLASDERGSFVV
jgi:hypothetical protein